MATPTRAKTFLITGAARGIGRGLSRLLLQNGHRVFLVDYDSTELDHTAARLAQTHRRGADFDALHCNLRQASEIQRAADAAGKLFDGRLDCLVNNAAFTGGVGGPALGDEGFLDVWQASIETNLTAAALLSRACLPLLRRKQQASSSSGDRQGGGGCILHISSTRAFQSEPNNEAYAATKAGLVGLMQAMAVSLAPDGIRCSAILPGWIHVANECKAADEKQQPWGEGLSAEEHAWQLTGRVGKVEDIWRAVEYLEAAEGVAGVEHVVDGGVTRKMVYPE